MLRRPLLLALSLAACSKGPQADLSSIGEARSLVAEWALVNEQAAAGHLDAPYTRTMRSQLRDQLRADARSLTQPSSGYAAEIRSALSEPDDAPAQELRAHATKLKAIESSLESA